MRKTADMNLDRDGRVAESRRQARVMTLPGRAALSESRETLQAVIDAVPAMINVKDTAFRYIMMNAFQSELYGVDCESAVGRSATELLGAEYGSYTEDLDRRVFESGEPIPFFEEKFCDVHEVWRTLLTTKVPLHDRSGTTIGIVTVSLDISRRKDAEQALRQGEQRYRSLFEAAPISLWEEDWSEVKKLVDELRADGASDIAAAFRDRPELLMEAGRRIKILDVNDATLKIYHADDKQKLIDEQHRRLRETPWPSLLEEIQYLSSGQNGVTTETDDTRLDGSPFHVRTTMELPKNHQEDWRRVFAAVEDITEARALSQQLRFQAAHDALTGLVNRREFENRLERALKSAEGGRSEHALCYLDLDQFKIINDTCGHVAGDELLRRLGRVLAQQVRRQDTLARLGGDEFGVLLEHCSMHVAERVANALRRTIEDFRFAWEKQIFGIGVSIGVVPIHSQGQTVSSILSAADAACYAAKDRGRNRIHIYHEGDVDLARRHGEMRWVTRIQTALEENRFELARQPIVSLSGDEGSDRHYELLLRMRDEDGKIVPPEAFLPAAERYNLSIKLDRWVVREAFRILTRDPVHLENLFLCSINLSGVSLADEDFLIFVTSELASAGLPPRKVCFEITETAAIANLPGAMRFIEVLRRIGCRFALDDFGSGLSSFAYLKSLPVDFLKIDGVFVKDIVDDPIDRELVRSINQIGHVMGKRTIAEFVESAEILSALGEIGVDYAQGFELGKPTLLTKL